MSNPTLEQVLSPQYKNEHNRNYYLPSEISEVLEQFMQDAAIVKKPGNKKQKRETVAYYNVPCSFDIETTSFYDHGEKRGIMYEWTLGLNGLIIIGRTWDEFDRVYQTIVKVLELGKNKRLRIYVHNLSFEFQFLMFRITWDRVFAIEERKPVEAITAEGVEFRCSYLLSGYSLDSLGRQLNTYTAHKMVGDLDYSLLRHSDTPMTKREIEYCRYDVLVVMAYIQEKIEANNNNITYLTLTKTGVVRKYCRKNCMQDSENTKSCRKRNKYIRMMKALTLEPDEYKQLKRAFQGGFTHANAWYSRKTVYNVRSYDFCSSYPYVLISEQFPMSKGEEVKIKNYDEFRKNIDLYCCLFDVELIGLESTTYCDHPLSYSKCFDKNGHRLERGTSNYTLDNGRIVAADDVFTTITEQDFLVLEQFYTWKELKIGTFRRYERGFLPTDFIKAILKLFGDKTQLKGVKGYEVEYQQSKEMLNACYGMAVTDIVRDEITFDGEKWTSDSPDLIEALKKYNTDESRFTSYTWGIWCTAYARRNLFTAIYELQEDYIYADTDSVKVLNGEKHQQYFDDYNRKVEFKLKRAMAHHVLPIDLVKPKTIKGKEKMLGVWEREDDIQAFKTLGAKRYMYLSDGQLHLTISGVNKHEGEKYLCKAYGKYGAFGAFNDGLIFPVEGTGKMIHTYIDDAMAGEITDYMGNVNRYSEFSGIHLENTEYSLSLTDAYISYLNSIIDVEE